MRSLTLKFGAALGGVALCVLLLLDVEDHATKTQLLRNETTAWATTLTTAIAALTETCMPANDSPHVAACAELQRLIAQVTREPRVQEVVITDRYGGVLARTGYSNGLIPVTGAMPLPVASADAAHMIFVTGATDPTNPAGKAASVNAQVYLKVSLADALSELDARAWQRRAWGAGIAGALVLLLLGLLRGIVLRPVQALARQAEKIGAGDFSARSGLRPRPHGDELQRLAHTFDWMAEHIEQGDRARQQAVMAEREQRLIAESLRDIARTINTTLDLEQVLDYILANVGRVVPHDAANVMLLDRNGAIHFVRGRGYERYGALSAPHELQAAKLMTLRLMLETNRPLALADVRAHPNWVPQLPGAEWIRSYAGAPLCMKGRTIGFLNLDSATPGFFTAPLAERLQGFADQIAVAIENAQLYAQVHELAIVDELTGVYNRRGLFQLGEHEVSRALRYARPLAAIMLDLDHFKRVNDTYGHAAGDQVLRACAQCCRANVRTLDLIARYGGEELVVLLPETESAAAQLVAERLRQAIEDMTIDLTLAGQAQTISITASLGVATMGADIPHLAALIERADHAQYLAKQAGRNRVMENA